MLLSTLLDIFLQKSFLRLSTRATPAVVGSLSAKFLASTTAQARPRPLLSLDLPQRPPRHLDSPKALPPFQGDIMLDLHTLLARPHAPNAPVSANVDYSRRLNAGVVGDPLHAASLCSTGGCCGLVRTCGKEGWLGFAAVEEVVGRKFGRGRLRGLCGFVL
jgi:hypothetical protein